MQPKIYSIDDHGISLERVDPDALRVIGRLQDEGYTAYLVGGGVRDLLAGITPKDFDISTSASPEETKRLFRRSCLLIGRRFRLAHIRCGHHILEVSTFRAGDTEEDDLIVRDNTWGTPEEDVLRRDFTMNGLFYDPAEQTIIDYVGGCKDIKKGVLRTIGDPDVRFRQDPVRMIRLLKFRARLGFDVDEASLEALTRCHREITKSAPARLLEEIFRMLESGAADAFFRLLMEHQFLKILLPWLTPSLQAGQGGQGELGKQGERVYAFLDAADRMNRDKETPSLARPVLFCALVFPILEQEIKKQFLDKNKTPHMGEILDLVIILLEGIVNASFCNIPRRTRVSMQYILHTQYRFTPVPGTRPRHHKIAHNTEFPLALQFLKLRAQVDEPLSDVYEKWKPLEEHIHRKPPRRRRSRKRRRKPPLHHK